MNRKSLIFALISVSLVSFNLNLYANTVNQLITNSRLKNIVDIPNDPQKMMTWICSNQEDTILVEAKDNKIWSLVIEQKNWNCQENLANIPTQSLQFTCEPSEDGMLDILTVTWLNGKDKNKQMGQWVHQLSDEYNMICSMAKVGLLDDVEQ